MKEYNKKEVEELADKYATEQNSCYTNDFNGYVNGFKKAFELFGVSRSNAIDYKKGFELAMNLIIEQGAIDITDEQKVAREKLLNFVSKLND